MEKEALLETIPFGALRFPIDEGLCEEFPLPLEDGLRTVSLFIGEGVAEPRRQEAVTALLNAVPELCQRAKERIVRDFEADPVIAGYLQRRMDELGGAEDLFSVAIDFEAMDVMSPQKVFAAEMEAASVFLLPAGDGKVRCIVLFRHDPDLTGEYLAARFERDGELIDITTIREEGESDG